MADDDEELTLEDVLAQLHDPLDANPELRAQCVTLLVSRYQELLHQMAHHLLVVGSLDPSRCDLAQPVLGILVAFGYVLGATGVKADGADVLTVSPEDAERLRKLLGDVDLRGI